VLADMGRKDAIELIIVRLRTAVCSTDYRLREALKKLTGRGVRHRCQRLARAVRLPPLGVPGAAPVNISESANESLLSFFAEWEKRDSLDALVARH
jgi:hypothetical protein